MGMGVMILGIFDLSTYTVAHVVISLVAIAAGLIVAYGMLGSRLLEGWTALFLFTTVLTSLTGFGFPFDHVLPSHVVGALSLVALLIAILGYYLYRLAGAWRWIYLVAALVALWFYVFVLIVQAFQKISFLQPLAPTQSEPAFQIAQGAALVVFIVIGILAVRKFHPPAQA
jgi:hypothetical protein